MSDEERKTLLTDFKSVEKVVEKLEFKHLRTLKDKEIASNLLQASVEILEETNQQLTQKNEEIEQINAALRQQKELLEATAQKLELKLRELTHSYEALEQFSHIASHDLKTPLRSIAGYAQLIQRRYENHLDEQANEFIGYIVRGVRQMNDVIGDMQEFSRSSIRNQPPVLTNLNMLLDRSVKNLENEIRAARAEVITAVPLPTLPVHESGIVQLFQNLISNAVKFRSANVLPRIEIFAEKKVKHWHFRISDNGVGIEQGFAHKIFQPFQRLQTDLPGMGMGLAVCQKVVQLHHGDIWYERRAEGGSVFHFTIAV